MGALDWLRDRAVAIGDMAVNALPARCPVPWRPHALAPVFSGYRDYAPSPQEVQGFRAPGFDDIAAELGAPTPLRVWFPSIGGSPQSNEILAPCGQYPLVVFAHGQCFVRGDNQSQRTHYLAWGNSRIVRQQARAGYVAVVPQLEGAAPGSDQDLDTLHRVVAWMRSDWEHAQLLAPSPSIALIGHSRGAVHAARLAAEGGVGVYASLSGEISEWYSADPTSLELLAALDIPKLFFMEPGQLQLDASWFPPGVVESSLGDTWDRISRPKHRALIEGMQHFDYVLPGLAPCEGGRGPCPLTPDIAADVLTMFLGRYLRPPAVSSLASRIPATLIVPSDWQELLSMKQNFYSGAYLRGIPSLTDSSSGCHLTLTYDMSRASDVITLPR